jgi:hypothetical protein
VVGALWAIVSGYAAPRRVNRLPVLIDHLAFLLIAPYTGPKAAGQAIDAARRSLARNESV